MTVVLTGLGGYIALKAFGFKNALAGCCEGSTAGNAVATPAAIAAVDASYKILVPEATAQIAAACILSAVLCPMLVVMMNKYQERRGIYAPKKLIAVENH